MPYRILSLDGGGTWALIQVKALQTLFGENATGHAILQQFDLVAANSGGSIVLGGLLEDLTLSQILGMFQDADIRRSIFSSTDNFWDHVLQDLAGIGPKYSAENKLPALQHVFPKCGNMLLKDATAGIRRAGAGIDIHAVIVAFDYDRNRGKYFRSAAASSAGSGTGDADDITVAEAIHASTNAPVNYFDAPAGFPDRPGRYWDGAITGNNNPVLSAVTEAIVLNQSPAGIAALSIGTGSVVLPMRHPGDPDSPFYQPIVDSGIKTDLRKQATSILDDPPNAASFLAHIMTGGKNGVVPPADSRIVRMSPQISPVKDGAGKWIAPPPMTAAQFNFLANLDMDAVDQHQVDAITKYTELWLKDVAPNQPVRMNGDTLVPEVGQGKFSGAVAAWNAIK